MNRANARGFAMDIKLIAKPLMVKTQAKSSHPFTAIGVAAYELLCHVWMARSPGKLVSAVEFRLWSLRPCPSLKS
jgi:hypothetical protein